MGPQRAMGRRLSYQQPCRRDSALAGKEGADICAHENHHLPTEPLSPVARSHATSRLVYSLNPSAHQGLSHHQELLRRRQLAARGLSSGSKAAIGICSAAALLAIMFLIALLHRRRHRRHRSEYHWSLNTAPAHEVEYSCTPASVENQDTSPTSAGYPAGIIQDIGISRPFATGPERPLTPPARLGDRQFLDTRAHESPRTSSDNVAAPPTPTSIGAAQIQIPPRPHRPRGTPIGTVGLGDTNLLHTCSSSLPATPVFAPPHAWLPPLQVDTALASAGGGGRGGQGQQQQQHHGRATLPLMSRGSRPSFSSHRAAESPGREGGPGSIQSISPPIPARPPTHSPWSWEPPLELQDMSPTAALPTPLLPPPLPPRSPARPITPREQPRQHNRHHRHHATVGQDGKPPPVPQRGCVMPPPPPSPPPPPLPQPQLLSPPTSPTSPPRASPVILGGGSPLVSVEYSNSSNRSSHVIGCGTIDKTDSPRSSSNSSSRYSRYADEEDGDEERWRPSTTTAASTETATDRPTLSTAELRALTESYSREAARGRGSGASCWSGVGGGGPGVTTPRRLQRDLDAGGGGSARSSREHQAEWAGSRGASVSSSNVDLERLAGTY